MADIQSQRSEMTRNAINDRLASFGIAANRALIR
jgi:hypothetical protein